jgi:predicted alpha/beta-fold hydrolase
MTEIKATNITWHEGHVTRDERNALLEQKGCTIWFTGLSGSGKSTIAYTLEHALVQRGHLAYVLDRRGCTRRPAPGSSRASPASTTPTRRRPNRN